MKSLIRFSTTLGILVAISLLAACSKQEPPPAAAVGPATAPAAPAATPVPAATPALTILKEDRRTGAWRSS